MYIKQVSVNVMGCESNLLFNSRFSVSDIFFAFLALAFTLLLMTGIIIASGSSSRKVLSSPTMRSGAECPRGGDRFEWSKFSTYRYTKYSRDS